MLLNMHNTTCAIVSATEAEMKWISGYLSFSNSKAYFSGGPSKIGLVNEFNRSFPTGFLPMIRKAAATENIEILAHDKRIAPATFDADAEITYLRDYQLDALDAVDYHKRGILNHATGAGKTLLTVALTQAYQCPWVLLTHRGNLAEQTEDEYNSRTGLTCSTLRKGDNWVNGTGNLTIFTFQSIAHRVHEPVIKNILLQAGGLMIEEAHVLPAATFYKTAQACPAYFRVGLSATPLVRGDRRSIMAIASLGPVIHKVSAEELINRNILARANITMYEYMHTKQRSTDYAEVREEEIVDSDERNELLIDIIRKAEKPCLAFITIKDHGFKLNRLLERAGFKSLFVYGTSSLSYRKRVCKDLNNGKLDVLVASKILDTGQNIPELRSVVNCSGGKSVIEVVQKLGRGMRRTTTKTEFDMYDVYDKGCGCDLAAKEMLGERRYAHKACEWLERHTKMRWKAYTVEKHSVKVEPFTR
jgi:superfamily II DNA or RNA helicase